MSLITIGFLYPGVIDSRNSFTGPYLESIIPDMCFVLLFSIVIKVGILSALSTVFICIKEFMGIVSDKYRELPLFIRNL